MNRQVQFLKMTLATMLIAGASYAAMNIGTQSKVTALDGTPVVILEATNGVYSSSTFFQNTSSVPCLVTSDTNTTAWYYIPANATLSISDVELRTWYGKTTGSNGTVNAIREISLK